jgi:hypothetical protein
VKADISEAGVGLQGSDAIQQQDLEVDLSSIVAARRVLGILLALGVSLTFALSSIISVAASFTGSYSTLWVNLCVGAALLLLSLGAWVHCSRPWLQLLVCCPPAVFFGLISVWWTFPFLAGLYLVGPAESIANLSTIMASFTAGESIMAVLTTGAFGYLVLILFRGLLSRRSLRLSEIAYRSEKRAVPYWLFIVRNARYTGDSLKIVAGIIGCVVVLLGLAFFTGIVLGLIVIGIAYLWVLLMRRLSRTVPWEAASPDRARRSVCLYLRSFLDDSMAIRQEFYSRMVKGPVLSARRNRIEEVVVKAIWPHYAVVAVGYSSADDSPMAALRATVSDDNWQDAVREIALSAEMIVLQAGFTPGLRWEHGHLAEQDALHKTLILFAPEGPAERRERWNALFGVGTCEDALQPGRDNEQREGDSALVDRIDGWKRWTVKAIMPAMSLWRRRSGKLTRDRKLIVDRTIACIWTADGRRLHFTCRSNSRIAYDLALRLACAATAEEILDLAVG